MPVADRASAMDFAAAQIWTAKPVPCALVATATFTPTTEAPSIADDGAAATPASMARMSPTVPIEGAIAAIVEMAMTPASHPRRERREEVAGPEEERMGSPAGIAGMTPERRRPRDRPDACPRYQPRS
jgi:hypothetical protein